MEDIKRTKMIKPLLSIVPIRKKVTETFSEKANKEVVMELERLLARAKRGEISILVTSCITENNEIYQSRSGDWEGRTNSIIGMMEDAKFEMLSIQNGLL